MNANFHELEQLIREGDHLMVEAIETRRPIMASIAGGYIIGGCYGSTFREAVSEWLTQTARKMTSDSDLDC